jgi:hypothetical protein
MSGCPKYQAVASPDEARPLDLALPIWIRRLVEGNSQHYSPYAPASRGHRESGPRICFTGVDRDSITTRLSEEFARSTEKATKLFTNWKHNADILPKMQGRLEVLRDARGKFQAVVYDLPGSVSVTKAPRSA